MDKLKKNVGKLKKVEQELIEAKRTQTALEQEQDQKTKSIRDLEGKCDKQAYSIEELKMALSEMATRNEELSAQCDAEKESCRLMEEDRNRASHRAEDLQQQFKELHKDQQMLRKAQIAHLQEKAELVQKMKDTEQHKKIHFYCLLEELRATESERDRIREQLELLQTSLRKASLELQDKCYRLESSTVKLESKLSALSTHNEELEGKCKEESEKSHLMENKCERLVYSLHELETQLNEMTTNNELLRRQLDDEAEKFQFVKRESDVAFARADELQKQRDELHGDHERLRKEYMQDLQKKTDYIEDLVEGEKQNKEKLESTKRSLKAKEMEYFALENAQLDLLQHNEEIQKEKQLLKAQLTQLGVHLEQMRAEVANATEERSALRAQLRDFVVTKAENEALKRDAEGKAAVIEHYDVKSKQLREFEKHLNKKKLALATERKVVAELKEKLERELANLQSTVKTSIQESFTERGEELLKESHLGPLGGSESSLDGSFGGGSMGRRDVELLSQHYQQQIRSIEESKQELEEAVRLKERETVLLQHQLNIAKQEVVQHKSAMLCAEEKAQESTVMLRTLAESYFRSHKYPPFLYQLHQKGMPTSDVESPPKTGAAGKAKVSKITDLRLFHPDASWCEELQHLLSELRALPGKGRQACVSFSFLHCSGVITFYRFHVVLASQVLSREPEIHVLQLEGGVIPKAMVVYASTPLETKNLRKDFGISAQPIGILLSPLFVGDIPKLAVRLDEVHDTPPGLGDAERHLDAIIFHELQCRYKKFATPRIVPTVPPMGVAMAVI